MHNQHDDAPRDLRIDGAHGRGPRIVFRFDGIEVAAYGGESIAAALLAAGIRAWTPAPYGPPARALFCAMGVCQQCAVDIAGVRSEACRTPVRPGLDVRSIAAGASR